VAPFIILFSCHITLSIYSYCINNTDCILLVKIKKKILFLDALPVKMENELHEKMLDFVSSSIDGSDNAYTNSLSAVNVNTLMC